MVSTNTLIEWEAVDISTAAQRRWREAYGFPPSSADTKNEWIYISIIRIKPWRMKE